MSKRLLSFFLGELATIRLHCSSSTCEGVIEVSTSQLPHIPVADTKCPACNGNFRFSSSELIRLGQDIAALQKAGLEIEFVLPDNSDTAK